MVSLSLRAIPMSPAESEGAAISISALLSPLILSLSKAPYPLPFVKPVPEPAEVSFSPVILEGAQRPKNLREGR
jgi:hypothetical protein